MKTWVIYLIVLIVLEAIADIYSKQYSLDNKIHFALLALLCYIIANASWIISMRLNSNLTIGANIFSVSSGILAAFIGLGLYGEIITIKQIIGIALGFISLVLLF